MVGEPKSYVMETVHGRIAVADTGGSGLPLLMIHGNSSSHLVFRHQMRAPFATHRRVVAFDLPGHGASSDAPDPLRSYTIPGYADAAVEVLRQIGISEAAVFGWSLGGHVGIEMMPRLAGLRGLMITGTPPATVAQVAEAFRPTSHMALTGQEIFTEADIDAYAQSISGAPVEPSLREAVARTDGRARRIMVEGFLAGGGIDQRHAVETSAVPLAVVNGADDPFVDLDYVGRIPFANLWEKRCHLMVGLGHAPFWQSPEAFNAILERFLMHVEARPA